MINELNAAISDYQLKWKTLAAARHDRNFFEGLKPTAVGWKTSDPADFDKRFAALRAQSDQIHLGWLNERWIATFHLRDQALAWGVTLVKLMQRRPGSTDRIGLDHLDFLAPAGLSAASLKIAEPGLNATDERNGHCRWTSVWFDKTEAKLRSDTVLDICIIELQDSNKLVMGGKAVAKT